MTYLFYFALIIFLFWVIYRIAFRKEFMLVKFLENRLGCSRSISKHFILFHLREKSGEKWISVRKKFFSDDINLEDFLVPWFLMFVLERTKSEITPNGDTLLFNEFLMKADLTEEEYQYKIEKLKAAMKDFSDQYQS